MIANSGLSTPPSTPLPSVYNASDLDTPQSRPIRQPALTPPGVARVEPLSMDVKLRLERINWLHPSPKLVARTYRWLQPRGSMRDCEEALFNQLLSSKLQPSEQVEYLADSTHLKVTFTNGIALWNKKPLGSNRDDQDLQGQILYVVGKDNHFYCHGSRYKEERIQAPNFHHSSFFASGKVLAAGTLTVSDQGIIQSISNDSGHYRTPSKNLNYAIRLLEQNMKENDFNVLNVYEMSGNRRQAKPVLEFIQQFETPHSSRQA